MFRIIYIIFRNGTLRNQTWTRAVGIMSPGSESYNLIVRLLVVYVSFELPLHNLIIKYEMLNKFKFKLE